MFKYLNLKKLRFVSRFGFRASDLCSESGQTLVETIVAIFLLITALLTALSLAIYAFATVTTSQEQVIASNLAREGIDVIRYARDTNWLEGDAKGAPYSLSDCSADLGAGKQCYTNWLLGPSGSGYHNFDLSQGNRRVQLAPASNIWTLENNSAYNLYLQPADGSYTHNPIGTSEFARKIILTYNTASPYTATNPEVIAQAVVGWRGKRCTWIGDDPTVAPSSCKITVEEHLTNWKDYK